MKGKLLAWFLQKAPYSLIRFFMPVLWKMLPAECIYEDMLLHRFLCYFSEHFTEEIKEICKKNRYMIIKEARFDFRTFNICYLNDVLGLIVYAFSKGYMPVIEVKNCEGDNIWNDLFLQPNTVYNEGREPAGEVVVCDRKSLNIRPKISTIYKAEERALWSFFYQKLVVLNPRTLQYIYSEIEELDIGNNSLGVLVRGTDYTRLKPSGHPVQPDIDEVILKIREKCNLYGYNTIYVATEDKGLFEKISGAFGRDVVKENKRQYYDEKYKTNQHTLVGEVSFDRENDTYLKGLEYLSSLVILSKCSDFVGGGCGGTAFACFYSDGYRDEFIFDKGIYN